MITAPETCYLTQASSGLLPAEQWHVPEQAVNSYLCALGVRLSTNGNIGGEYGPLPIRA